MASTAYNYVDIHDGVPSGAAGVILNDNFSAISDITLDSIQGLHTSNGTDSSHDIDITVGAATDSTNADVLVLGSAITKRIDSAWAVGTGNGGIDTGSVSSSTWYAIWLIKRSDTGVVDALFSTSFSSPTMPTNYDSKRYIGAVKTNGSANILAYNQTGNAFVWVAYVVDLSDSTPATSITTLRVSTPPIKCKWIGEFFQEANGSSTNNQYVSPGDHTNGTAGARLTVAEGAGSWSVNSPDNLWTNSSGQIKYMSTASTRTTTFLIHTNGWLDPRGSAIV